jgi:EpsI family protein
MTHHVTISATRLIMLACAFAATAVFVEAAHTQRQIPKRPPLRGFPIQVEAWRGSVSPDFDERIVRILGADEYLTRIYQQGAEPPVDFFVGYYGSQTTGAVIHSPLNCLPGAGWQFLDRDRIDLEVDAGRPQGHASSRPITVNRVVMQKGEDRLVALYWYHERGRVIASEYSSRVYMMLDAARYGRTDGALIRVVTPVDTHGNATDEAARRLTAFVQTIFPLLGGYLPA